MVNSAPADTNTPTEVVPEVAFTLYIMDVCKVAGSLLINSKPKNIASIKMVDNYISDISCTPR